MKIIRYWKIVLGLMLVFTAGAVVGSGVTHHLFKRAFERSMKFENMTARAMQALQTRLNLTPDQHQKIQAIIEQTGPDFKIVFSKALADGGQIFLQTERRIDQELNPEQRAIHAELKRQFRDRLKRQLNFELPQE